MAYYDSRIEQYVAFVRYNQNLGFHDNGTCPLRRSDEMWLYYHGRNWRHGERPTLPQPVVRLRFSGAGVRLYACQFVP